MQQILRQKKNYETIIKSYKKSFSLTNPDQLQIGVEYKLNRNLSLVGNMDDKGNLHLKYRYRYAY